MNFKAILLFALILASSAFAYSLAIKVTVTQDTLAVGTNVSLSSGGVEFATQRAGLDGIASFNVTPGSYFVLLRRGGYPLHVSIVDVQNDTGITLTIWNTNSPFGNAYGQITGTSDFSNVSVAAYSDGIVVKRTKPNAYGQYTLSFVPEGTYIMLFEAPGFEAYRQEASLLRGDFVEVNADLKEQMPLPEPTLQFVAPLQVQQFSTIEIHLEKGIPLASQEISVQTPSGQITITTDASGVARLNAAEAGNYIFTYDDISTATKVLPKATISPPVEAQPPQEQPYAQPTILPKDKNNDVVAGVVVLVFATAALLIIIVIFAMKIFLPTMKNAPGSGAKETKEHSKKHPHKNK